MSDVVFAFTPLDRRAQERESEGDFHVVRLRGVVKRLHQDDLAHQQAPDGVDPGQNRLASEELAASFEIQDAFEQGTGAANHAA